MQAVGQTAHQVVESVQVAPNAQQIDILSNTLIIAIVGVIIMSLLGVVAWFAAREIVNRDRLGKDLKSFELKIAADMVAISTGFTTELHSMADRSNLALESLNKAISQLAVALTEQRVWMAEHYVSKSDFKEDLKVAHERISRTNVRMDALEDCPRGDCPAKGDPRATWPGGVSPMGGHHGTT